MCFAVKHFSTNLGINIMEVVTGFFVGLATGYLLTWPALVVLFLFGTLFEYNGARGWAVFTGLIAIAVSFFYFDVPMQTIAIYAAGYFGLGLAWSIWRYKRFVDERSEEIRKSSNSPRMKGIYAEQLRPTNNLDTIAAWILIWPFSFVERVAGDLINAVQTLITKVFKGVYNKIFNAAVGDLIKEAEEAERKELEEARLERERDRGRV